MEIKKVTYTQEDLDKNKHCALVLQGGSLRCLFTSGVLDYFMEKGIWFPYVNGVSAGSLCAINYLSGQIGRTAKVNIDYANNKRYLGLKNLVKTRNIFNFDFLFGEITDNLIPLDKEAFFNSPISYTAIAVNCLTGESAYFNNHSGSDMMRAARASSSLPLLSKRVVIEGKPCLDGGVCEPVAFKRAYDEGYKKQVIILTRELGYRKSPASKALLTAYRRTYKNFPKLVSALENLSDTYNQSIERIEKLEMEGKVFVIRPLKPITISRFEKDTSKLETLYKEGYQTAKDVYNSLQIYLQK